MNTTVRHAMRDYFAPLVKLQHTIDKWKARAKYRNELRSMDERMLRDMGITITDAQNEYNKPFWRK